MKKLLLRNTPTPSASQVVLLDTFAGPAETRLINHTSNSGHTWISYVTTEFPSYPTDIYVLNGTSGVTLDSWTNMRDEAMISSSLVSCPNLIIEIDLNILQPMQARCEIGMLFRGNLYPGGENSYQDQFDEGRLYIYHNPPAAEVDLGNRSIEGNSVYAGSFVPDISVGMHYLKLVITGSLMQYYYDNVLVAQRNTASVPSRGNRVGFFIFTNDDLGRFAISRIKFECQ